MTAPVDKPNLLQRLWYLIGGRLPRRYREWVFADVTKPSWLAWFALRSVLQVLPLSLVVTLGLVLLLDAPLGLAIACGALGLLVGVYYSLSYAVESVEHRITKYGYPNGLAAQTRRDRDAEQDRERQARYNASWRSTGDQPTAPPAD
ncbi:DUF5313 family protein [Goodfellowiella coeruleoviolacea]|uniref:DUF5313 domain-containing protein n=1 Tax=Goodfellowiella coeruleoviolacea TaxID=334858 RepID=A0AAE3GCH6_9PSEU|nr:DUF5313 family protein [Goodfellowiella coeruleoviolacea]MCP2164880.1 hypothetical protein [Goodfellowiella coeruleoviolacea]